jgi:hypothetical protein
MFPFTLQILKQISLSCKFLKTVKRNNLILNRRFKIAVNTTIVERQVDSICMFRKDILPAWEDPQNVGGSDMKIEFRINKDQDKELDNLFVNLISELIAEDFEYSKHVNYF